MFNLPPGKATVLVPVAGYLIGDLPFAYETAHFQNLEKPLPDDFALFMSPKAAGLPLKNVTIRASIEEKDSSDGGGTGIFGLSSDDAPEDTPHHH